MADLKQLSNINPSKFTLQKVAQNLTLATSSMHHHFAPLVMIQTYSCGLLNQCVKDCMVKDLSSIFYQRRKGEFFVIWQFFPLGQCSFMPLLAFRFPANSSFHWFAKVSQCHHFTIDSMSVYDVHNTMYLSVINVGCFLF